MDKIIVKHTYISIPNYTLGDSIYLENKLSIYDKVCHKMIPKGYVYIEENNELRIPSGIDPNYIGRILNRNVEIDYTPDPYSTAVFNLVKEPRSGLQKEAIGFLTGRGDFQNTSKYSQLSLSIDTGEGKTYCSITALIFLRQKSIIIVNTKKVKSQWLNCFSDYTDMTANHICNVDSSAKISAILKYKGELKYKTYITLHRTIQSYGKRYGWDKITEFFKKIEVGVKIFDEAHLEFDNTIRINCYTNTKRTFQLTANFEKSDYKENKLFQFCFKCLPKYIQKDRGVFADYNSKEHITYISYIYDSEPSIAVIGKCRNRHGFDKNRFTEYQMEKDNYIFPIIHEFTKFFTVDKELKTMILVSTISGCEIINKFIKENFYGIRVGMYHSKVKEKNKDILIEESDIIISTSKSLGTGADIAELLVLINLEPYRSLITANQISGRLRKIPGKQSYYIEIINKGFTSIYSQYKERLKFFKGKLKSIKTIDKTKR